ncbi:MAG: SLC13 family permease [Endomicrobiia bacterium]
MVSIVILAIVFILIATRRIGSIKLQVWQIMFFGALTVLLTRQISIKEAFMAISWEVMLFLFSMFIIGEAVEKSGYLAHITYKIFKKAKSLNWLLIYILFVMGFASSILMNDTVAIVGTPVVLLLARKHNIEPKILLLTLAFAITIGSVMSPLGNPQNFLIATQSNIKNPFFMFAKYLFLPTVINLYLTFLVLKIVFKKHFNNISLVYSQEPIKDRHLSILSKVSLILLLVLIVMKILTTIFFPHINIKLVYITAISSLPIVIFSRKRLQIIKKVDWQTLVFFASMFILMQSVWDTRIFQKIIENTKINITSLTSIMLISTILSQLISNVPLVNLYLQIIESCSYGIKELMALASASTVAGNFTILAAASNIIIIHTAEKKLNQHNIISFFEFFKIGSVITLINISVYLLFLKMLP